MESYLTNVQSYFDEKTEKQFENGLENAIYYLISLILNQEKGGVKYFIKIPMREIGVDNYTESYVDFCGSVAFAAGKFVYEYNSLNELPEINLGEFFEYKNAIYVQSGKYSFKVEEVGNRNGNNASVEFKNKSFPRLSNTYDYSGKSARKSILDFKSWAGKFNEKPQILNNIDKKVLIISHSEIEKSDWVKMIPHCKIDENGNLHHSSPMESFIYLARDENAILLQMIEQEIFDSVIFLGDSKFRTDRNWSVKRGKIKKIIYVGYHEPEGIIEYYTFSPNEIFNFYGVSNESIQFKKEDIQFSPLLNEALIKFVENVKEIQAKGVEFKFSLQALINRTAPIDEFFKEKMEDWFENYILNNFSFSQEEYIEPLLSSYSGILEALNNGIPQKISFIKKIVNDTSEKKKDTLYFIVSQKDEIDYLANSFGIKREQFIQFRSFSRKLKSILNSKKHKNSKKNKYVFLAFDNKYNDLIKMMDNYTLLGERIFVGKVDSRFKTIKNEREKYFIELLSKECREEINGIKFDIPSVKEEEITDSRTLEDFEFDSDYEFILQRDIKVENYQISLENGSAITLNGNVIIEDEIEDVGNLKVGDEFVYYRNEQILFDKVWHLYQPELAIQIDYFSQIWKNTLIDLRCFFENEKQLLEELKYFKWKAELPTLRAYLRENCQTQFPRYGSLSSIKKLCDSLEEFKEDPFVLNYENIRRAQKALSLKVKLGRVVCKALYESILGIDSDEDIVKKILEADLFEELKEKCLCSGKVLTIKKIK